jgi:hypothetical protein
MLGAVNPEANRLSDRDPEVLFLDATEEDAGQAPEIRERHVDLKNMTSPHMRAMVELYYAIEALRSTDGAFAIQFLDVDSDPASTSVARGYARVAATSRPEPVLIIECGDVPSGKVLAAVPGLLDCLRQDKPLRNAFVHSPAHPNLLYAKFSVSPMGMPELDATSIKRLLKELGPSHPIVVVNSPRLNLAPGGAGWSRFIDGTVLVVSAGRTSSSAITAARFAIERAGGQILGVVMNGGESKLPAWLRRWF